jgi:hypothetical protein
MGQRKREDRDERVRCATVAVPLKKCNLSRTGDMIISSAPHTTTEETKMNMREGWEGL